MKISRLQNNNRLAAGKGLLLLLGFVLATVVVVMVGNHQDLQVTSLVEHNFQEEHHAVRGSTKEHGASPVTIQKEKTDSAVSKENSHEKQASGSSSLSLSAAYFPSTCSKGTAPWEALSRQEWRDSLRAFIQVWSQQRPQNATNVGGGGVFHYFGLWIVVKQLKPEVIIESGAFQGIGTWLLRQAAGPDTHLIVLSPATPALYVDNGAATYLTGNKFVDFAKIDRSKWMEVLRGTTTMTTSTDTLLEEKTLIFFDDHQAAVHRVQHARQIGFRHVMFDDNYLPSLADNMALKQVCAGWKLWEFFGLTQPIFRDNFSKISQPMDRRRYEQHVQQYEQDVATYAEFPPLWDGPNRFGITTEQYGIVRAEPLFTMKELQQDLGLNEQQLGTTWDEQAKRYTFIPYVQLNPPTMTT